MRWFVAIASCFYLACGSAEERPAPPVDVAPPPLRLREPEVKSSYSVFGTPGPWWREDATDAAFQRDLKLCITQSNALRAQSDDPASAAYQGFIDCMTQNGWTRGVPPIEERTISLP